MRVAVTGSDGFIGSAVRQALHRQGITPVCLDLPMFDVRTLTLGALSGCDAVIHLAGVLGTDELFDDVQRAIDVNVSGTARVLAAAQVNGARYVGITMPPLFKSIYTATKLAAEGLERAYHHAYGLPVSRVRAFNAYGPGQRHGEGAPQKLIPTFATEAWAGRPLPIWGDGTQTVDLIHVDDLAALLVECLDHGDDWTVDGGTGFAFSVNQVAEAVLDITGSRAGVEHLPMRRGEVPTKVVAEGEGWNRLSWVPGFSLERLEEAVGWYRASGRARHHRLPRGGGAAA